MYSYKDGMTDKIRRTRGVFEGWSEKTGPLNVRYAIFKNPCSRVCIPYYLLTPETKAALPPMPNEVKKEGANST